MAWARPVFATSRKGVERLLIASEGRRIIPVRCYGIDMRATRRTAITRSARLSNVHVGGFYSVQNTT